VLTGSLGAVNRFWHGSVTDAGSARLEATTHYADPWFELRGRLAVRPVSYRVLSAQIEVMRAPGGRDCAVRQPLNELSGAIAYAGIGRRIRDATASDATGLWGGVLVECVKVLRQARLFVWQRLGIDPADHLPLIRALLENACAFYSLPGSLRAVVDPVQLQEMVRWDCLFSRHKYCLVHPDDAGERVVAGLSDSYHEMQLCLTLRADRVEAAQGSMLRAPHEPCFAAEAEIEGLRGATLDESPGEWERRLVGRRGCAHLADLAREVCSSVLYARRAAASETGSPRACLSA